MYSTNAQVTGLPHYQGEAETAEGSYKPVGKPTVPEHSTVVPGVISITCVMER